MGWGDIDLSTVPADNELLPAEVFNFVVTGGKPNKFNSNKVDVSAKVADGQYKGTSAFFSYPDPAEQEWSVGVFKRLVNSIGIKIEEGESPVDYLNRVAKAGGKFTAPIKHRDIEKDGLVETRGEVNTWKISTHKG